MATDQIRRINKLIEQATSNLERIRSNVTEPKIYTKQEAIDAGFELDDFFPDDYRLQVTPDETLDTGFKVDFITPDNFKVDIEGNVQPFAMPEFKAPEMPTVQPEIQREQTFNVDMANQIISSLRQTGRTPGAEQFLRDTFPQITDEDINQIFRIPTLEYEAPRLLQKALPSLVTSNTVDTMINVFADKPEYFRDALVAQGKNDNTVALLKYLHPKMTDRDIDKYLDPYWKEHEEAAKKVNPVLGALASGMGELASTVGGAARILGVEGLADNMSYATDWWHAYMPADTLGSFQWSHFLNPQFYVTRVLPMIPSLVVLAGTSIGGAAAAGAGLAKLGIGGFGRYVLEAVAGTAVSRPLESAMEAGGAYDDAISKGFTSEEANDVASEVFKQNLKLAGSDFGQLALALAPRPIKSFEGLIGKGLAKTVSLGGKIAGVALTEGGEEVYQEIIRKKALGEEQTFKEMLRDPDMQQVFALGALAGVGFAGAVDVYSRVKQNTINSLNPEQKEVFNKAKSEALQAGERADVATQKGLDAIAETEGGKAKIEQAAKKTEREVAFEQVKPKDRVDAEFLAREEAKVRGEEPETFKVQPDSSAPPIERVKYIKSELQSDINITKQKIADIKTPVPEQGADVQFARLALRDADKLLNKLDTQIDKIEKGQEVSEEEIGFLQDRLASLKDFYNFNIKNTQQAKELLTNYINDNLPLEKRGKLLSAVKNIKTPEDLNQIFNRIDNIAEEYSAKQIRNNIRNILKKVKPKKKQGILKGKLTADVQQQIELIRNNIDGDRDLALEKIQSNLKAYEEGSLSLDEVSEANDILIMTGIDSMDSNELQAVYDNIKSLIDTGKTLRQQQREARKERLEPIKEGFVDTLTGKKGLKPGRGTLPAEALAKKPNWLERLTNNQYGWPNLLDKLSKFSKSKPYQSFISKFGENVYRSRNTEKAGLELYFTVIKDNFKRIFNAKSVRRMNQILRNMTDQKIYLGTFKNGRGEEVTLELSKFQIISKYQQMQDPTLEDTFKETEKSNSMAWADEMMDAVRNNLTEQEKAWADWEMQFYQEYYFPINEVYRRIYGIDMPHNPYYVPIRRDFDEDTSENLLIHRDLSQYASVENGSLKARVKNKQPLKFNSSIEVLINHITQMEHFKAWADTISDLRSVFGDREVSEAITQYHGKDINTKIKEYINDFARNGIEKAKINHVADFLRRNFTVATLGIKPAIALKQVPSGIAYMTEMPIGDFVSGVADFWLHPLENYKFMIENSVYLRERFGAGFERDIKYAIEKHGVNQLVGSHNLRDYFLTLIRLGDKFTVIQGYWAKYKSEINKGVSQEEALLAAQQSTERTQPSFNIESLSAWQRGGSFMKLLTMFQNQPNKYFRLIADNMRNFKYGRGSRAKAASNIFIAWVIAPALFQFIADAFQFRPERQARAWVLGPVNYLLIAGQFAQSLYNWIATDEFFDYDISPVQQTFDDILTIVGKARKLVEKGQDPYVNVTMDDAVAFLEYFGKVGGEVVGLPTPWLVQAIRAIREGKPMELIFSRWSLEKPKDIYEDTKLEEDKLGVPDELEEGEKFPDTYTMKDLNSFFRVQYNHVLPDDILNDDRASDFAKSWAQKEKETAEYFILPNVKLSDINTNADEDWTIIDYRKQWKAREQIDNLADLTEFDKIYDKAYLGNVTDQQYLLLVSFLKADDKDKFLEEHPELKINPRVEWLKNNPSLDAQLALWGQADIYSIQAYNDMRLMMVKLNVPYAAVSDILPPENVAKTHFEYLETMSEYGANSAETKLLITKNEEYRKWRGFAIPEFPEEYYQISVDWRGEDDLYAAYGDKDSTEYIENEKLRKGMRDALRNHEKDGVTYGEADRRREAISKEIPDKYVEEYIEFYEHLDTALEQKRWLLSTDHIGFYKDVYQGILGNQPVKISMAESKEETFHKYIEAITKEFNK